MKKLMILMTTGFFFMICAALLWQWKTFSESKPVSVGSPEGITHVAAVKLDADGFSIEQTYSNLDSELKYHAILPAKAIGVTCSNDKGKPCGNEWTKTNKLVFEYSIDSPRGSSILLKDWLVVLEKTEIKNTRVEVVDQFFKKGTWAAGLPQRGYKQLELLHYYVFEGVNPAPALYWQEKPLSKRSLQNGIDYYSSRADQLIYQFDSLEKIGRNQHLTVILQNNQEAQQGNGLLIAGNQHTEKEIEQLAAEALLSAKFRPDEPASASIIDVMASLVIKQEPGDPKSKRLMEELNNNLDAKELADFISYFSLAGALDMETLDGYLSKLKGLETNFFTLISRTDKEVPSLYFTDPRRVVVNGVEKPGLDVVIKNGRSLYPLAETMDALGYVTKAGPGLVPLEISSAERTYAFNLNNNTFTIDGESFGLLKKPFQQLNGEWYLEKEWLKAIFKIGIIEKQGRILLEQSH
ncbi:hypothetical protein [Mesobacillus thioparans]|uniref:hypothetical protein n=1 Tax=Mesobacillus thioparans TaxID=370439 RepID=UPI0039EF7E7C